MSEPRPDIQGCEVVGFITRGAVAGVWRVRRVGMAAAVDDEIAAKVYDRGQEAAARREWNLSRTFSHVPIVPALKFTEAEDGRSVLLMPYCAGGTLADLAAGRRGLSGGELVSILSPVVKALRQLHRAQLVHAEVRPDNILFTAQGSVLLSGLGSARRMDEMLAVQRAPAAFTAPEVLDGMPPGPAADMYALGATCWFALLGEPPPPVALRARVRDAAPDLPADLAEAIESMLALTPAARITADHLLRLVREAQGVAAPAPVTQPGKTRPAGHVITRRRCAAGVRRRRNRRPAHRSRSRRSWRGSSALLGVGIVLLALSAWVPTPPIRHATPPQLTRHPDTRRAEVPAPENPPPRTPVHPVRAPTRADITRLLDCRAAAWNSGQMAVLDRCLSQRSQAGGDDRARLVAARRSGQTFQGVRFIVGAVHGVFIEQGAPTVRVQVTSSAYEMKSRHGSRRVPAEQLNVRLRFVEEPGGWKISAWDVV